MKSLFLFLFIFKIINFANASEAKKLIAQSTNKITSLIELYSSESCSSCPPADDWVSKLQQREGLWQGFIPVVFHVDYWNYLDWKDGLSSDLMTKRQVDISNQWAKASVYTPGFVLNGEEWKNWPKEALPKAINDSIVQLSIFKNKDFEFITTAKSISKKWSNKKYLLRVALLGMGLKTKVTSGENSGKTLTHNFVILDWKTQNLELGKDTSTTFAAPKQRYLKLAVVAWLEETGNLNPIQSVGGYL